MVIASSEPDFILSTDASRIRELLKRAGRNQRVAARELEIDERWMRGCRAGRPGPRYLVLAPERPVGLRVRP